jgi:hypothetical protein
LDNDESIVHRIRKLAATLVNSGGSRNELQHVHQQKTMKNDEKEKKKNFGFSQVPKFSTSLFYQRLHSSIPLTNSTTVGAN